MLQRLNDWARTSVTLKLLIIGAMILVLMIPTLLVNELIDDRQRLRDGAQREVAANWGFEQTIGGPVISVPYSYETIGDNGKTISSNGYAHFLPDEVDVRGKLLPEERYRGIYVVVLYNTKLTVSGNFGPLNAAALNVPESALNWEDALFTVGISDMTGVQSRITVELADTSYELGPGTVTRDVFTSGASVPIRITGQETALAFNFQLDLNGSSGIHFRPFGRSTTVALAGDWANPSFQGGFLPQDRAITSEAFTANWEVLELNRNYPQQGTGPFVPHVSNNTGDYAYTRNYVDETPAPAYDNQDRFGVELLLPVDEYQKTYRSTNFAFLFIFITFLTFFFIEVLNRRRVHPIQYLLIGAAIILFYVLLLSISEHLRFDVAYWMSCAAIVALITTYSWFILRNAKLTSLVAGVLIVLYVFFYSLLQLQDYALLFGSVGLLIILAVVMWLTRNIDWYDLGKQDGI